MLEKKLVPKLRFAEFDGFWNIDKVIELADFIVPGRNKPKKFNGDIPWITTPDIEHNGVILFSKKGLAISRQEAKKVGAKIVPSNSVIISCVGELGLTAITGVEMVINQQLHAFIPKEKIETRFLLYSVSNQKKYMDKVATKTAVPYMNKDNCNSIPVIYPSLPEQQKIASFLTEIDTKLSQLTKKKALLENYKKGVMQKIFSQELRFKDDDGNDYGDWHSSNIGNVFKSLKGKGIPKGDVINDGANKCVLYGELYTTYNEIISNVVSSTNSIDGLKSKKGDMLMPSSTTTTGIDLANVTALNFDNVSLGGDIIVLRAKKEINNVFYAYYLSNHKKYEIASRAQGITIVHIYFNSIKDLNIDVPSLKEQTKIANFLSELDTKIEVLSKSIENTQYFKKGLLQQLFV
jgi:type I restriction enzyme S subunit